jgi:transposase
MFEQFHQYLGEAMTDGFKVLPIARGPRKSKKVKAKVNKTAKRGPGRPRVYNGSKRRQVASALKRFGLTKGIERLAEKGLEISLTLARSVAKEQKISFTRGRPTKAA